MKLLFFFSKLIKRLCLFILSFGTIFLAALCFFTGSWWWIRNFLPNAMAHFWGRRQKSCFSSHEVQLRSAEMLHPREGHDRQLESGGVASLRGSLAPWWWRGFICQHGGQINFRLLNPTLFFKGCWNHCIYMWKIPFLATSAYLHIPHANLPKLHSSARSSTDTNSCPVELNQQSIFATSVSEAKNLSQY